MFLYSLCAVCYYFCMFKTSFLEQKKLKLSKKQKYHASYLKAYEFSLTQENNPDKEALFIKKTSDFKKSEAKYLAKAEKKDAEYKNRVWEIDLLRAIVIFGMLIEHLMFDFADMFPNGIFNRAAYLDVDFFHTMYNFASSYWANPVRIAFRFVGIITLSLLIGINTHFSKNNLKRALILTGAGLLMGGVFEIGAVLGMTGHAIVNIITSYGLCLLIFCAVEAIFKRYKKAWKWICLGIALAILVGWAFIRFNNLPKFIPEKYDNAFLIYHGYASSIPHINNISQLTFSKTLEVIFGLTYFGDDWLGILPFLGYIFLGAFIGQTLYRDKKSVLHYFDQDGSKRLNEKFNRGSKWFLFFGRHTIWIYLFHQVVYIVIALFIGGLIMGIPLGV